MFVKGVSFQFPPSKLRLRYRRLLKLLDFFSGIATDWFRSIRRFELGWVVCNQCPSWIACAMSAVGTTEPSELFELVLKSITVVDNRELFSSIPHQKTVAKLTPDRPEGAGSLCSMGSVCFHLDHQFFPPLYGMCSSWCHQGSFWLSSHSSRSNESWA